MSTFDRREFVAATAAAAAVGFIPSTARAAQPAGAAAQVGDGNRGPCFIGSGNGVRVTAKAMEMMRAGTYLLDAIVEGIKIVEDDPDDDSVGYGGLPNEEGVVQLDASVMDGPTGRAGAVGCLEKIKNPAAVALQVLRKTDHVMLVGAGALKFAKRVGFKEENLLTEHSRQEWEKWKAKGKNEWWLDEENQIKAPSGPTGGRSALDVRYTSGTVHCSGLDDQGRMASCTSTSGLSWKLDGRLGDSPIVGAGMYCDQSIGCAGSTGRGESVIQVGGALSVVHAMDRGLSPTQACLTVLKKIVDMTKLKRLLDEKGRPKFDVTMYALRKDGAYGAATFHPSTRRTFAVHDGASNRAAPCAFLYEA